MTTTELFAGYPLILRARKLGCTRMRFRKNPNGDGFLDSRSQRIPNELALSLKPVATIWQHSALLPADVPDA